MGKYSVHVRRYKLKLKGNVMGYRIEIWQYYPGGGHLEYACDTASQQLAFSIDAENYGSKDLHLEGDTLVTNHEENVTEIFSLEELNTYVAKVKNKIESREALGKKSIAAGKKFMEFLKRKGIEVDSYYTRFSEESIESRFLGGFYFWSGCDEDVCDADTMDKGLLAKIKGLIKEFNNIQSDFNVSLSEIGEKAWTYFNVTPKGF